MTKSKNRKEMIKNIIKKIFRTAPEAKVLRNDLIERVNYEYKEEMQKRKKTV